MNIEGIRALVTGGSRGIGLATAKALLGRGAARVGLLAHQAERLDTAVAELAECGFGDRVRPILADVAEPEALMNAIADFAQERGGLEVLVNNAGILLDGAMVSFSFRGVTRYSLADWQRTIDTNLRGVFVASQAAAEQMFRKRIKGVIVNISSVSRQGRAGQVAYSASKGGVASLTFTLAQELAPLGIRCVAVAPGMVDTPMAEQIPEGYRKQMLDHVAVGRLGTPDEIAHGVLFCIENDFFNGRVLELDGGAFG